MAAKKDKTEKWTRAHKLASCSLIAAIVSLIAGYYYFHSKANSPQQRGTQINGANGNINEGGTQINNGGNGTVINNSPGATLNQASPDYIEGTQYTEKELSAFFSYGYIVFFYGQNCIIRNQFFKTGLTDWKLDPEKVVIGLDIPSRMFTCTIPSVYTIPADSGPKLASEGTEITVQSRLVPGKVKQAGVQFGNQPVMYIMTLSDNQRTPVFALGFRIPAANEPIEMIVRP